MWKQCPGPEAVSMDLIVATARQLTEADKFQIGLCKAIR